jgi:Na+-transporting methylmalonyl-CoA/oxaloacetate decarboxylase gamma subunit
MYINVYARTIIRVLHRPGKSYGLAVPGEVTFSKPILRGRKANHGLAPTCIRRGWLRELEAFTIIVSLVSAPNRVAMRTTLFLALLVCLMQGLAPLIARSQEPSQYAPRRTVAQSQEASARKIEQLIEQLAAKNPKPREDSRKSPAKRPPKLPPHEPEIWEAVDELHRLGVAAFPQLIAHFDDQRFCCSEDSIAAPEPKLYHRSVGYVCQEIVRRQVERHVPWDQRDPRGLPGYSHSIVPRSKKAAQTWWEQNRSKELWELQVDNVNFVVVLNRERLKMEVDPARRALCEAAIRANEELAAELNKSKSPKPGKPFRPHLER